ncbi:MAG: hypothetical protein ACMG6E_01455, partial [Candidatus Roizmanbacteria bacterium]
MSRNDKERLTTRIRGRQAEEARVAQKRHALWVRAAIATGVSLGAVGGAYLLLDNQSREIPQPTPIVSSSTPIPNPPPQEFKAHSLTDEKQI